MLLSLNSFNKVKDFVNAITPLDIDVNLISGRYVVNAKSVMGIFSLDLSKPILVEVHAEGAACDEFIASLTKFIVE